MTRLRTPSIELDGCSWMPLNKDRRDSRTIVLRLCVGKPADLPGQLGFPEGEVRGLA